MARHTLVIPNWAPTSDNLLVGQHWSRVKKLKDADAQMVRGYALQAGIPLARGKRAVTVELHGWPRGRLPDPWNFLKSMLDALVKSGLLLDDDQARCQCAAPRLVRSPGRQAIITLEDCDD